jgi:hypothetical protein
MSVSDLVMPQMEIPIPFPEKREGREKQKQRGMNF